MIVVLECRQLCFFVENFLNHSYIYIYNIYIYIKYIYNIYIYLEILLGVGYFVYLKTNHRFNNRKNMTIACL